MKFHMDRIVSIQLVALLKMLISENTDDVITNVPIHMHNSFFSRYRPSPVQHKSLNVSESPILPQRA